MSFSEMTGKFSAWSPAWRERVLQKIQDCNEAANHRHGRGWTMGTPILSDNKFEILLRGSQCKPVKVIYYAP